MTIEEALKNCEYGSTFTDQEYDQLAEWLEELKIYRLAIKQCKESSYMVNSKEFAKRMEEWVKEQLRQVERNGNDDVI